MIWVKKIFLLMLYFGSLDQTYGFIPTNGVNFLLKILKLDSLTHRDITEAAILKSAESLLIANPNPNPEIDSTARINALSSLTTENLMKAYYGDEEGDLAVDNFEEAIDDINDANVNVDLGKSEMISAAAHFDSEEIQGGHNRIVKLKKMAVIEIKAEYYKLARMQTGRMLHTIQDFYSHSNWIEMGKTLPYSVLGDESKNPENIAPPTRATCNDCTQEGEIGIIESLALVLKGAKGAKYNYKCTNNIRSDINVAGILTTGYYTGQENIDGEMIDKPTEKCSHGGFLDSSSDLSATGGINKDSIFSIWSPHADQYLQAADIAITASQNILNDIRSEVANDTKFSAFLGINLDETQTIASIAFVIDTTGSMGEELPEIQATIPGIRTYLEGLIAKNADVKLILVPFNDPDPGTIITTKDIDVFLNAIASLSAFGGGDCPEPSIGAMIRATKASEKESSIFLFTDADASDPERKAELQALITQKDVHLHFILPGTCSSRKRRSVNGQDMRQKVRTRRQTAPQDLYAFLATYSGGQVLNINTADISELSSIITLSAETTSTQILYKTGTGSFSGNVYFSIDSTISRVIISLNGQSISETIRIPGGDILSTLDSSIYSVNLDSSSSFIAAINVTTNNLHGLWQLTFSSTTGMYSIQISASSSLKFSHKFYQLDPDSHFGFSSLEGNPIQGQTLILLITTSGENEGINFTKATILNGNGAAVQYLNLTKVSDKSFATSFLPILTTFQFEITGVDRNENPVQRVSGSGVQISDVDLRLGLNGSRFNSLYPGNTSNTTLLLSNYGDSSSFIIDISSDGINYAFSYKISKNSITLSQNETGELVLTVTALQNASDGDSIQLITTVSTSTVNNERSNFVSILFFASTIPPPNITTNIFAPPDAATTNQLSILLLLSIILLNSYLQLFTNS